MKNLLSKTLFISLLAAVISSGIQADPKQAKYLALAAVMGEQVKEVARQMLQKEQEAMPIEALPLAIAVPVVVIVGAVAIVTDDIDKAVKTGMDAMTKMLESAKMTAVVAGTLLVIKTIIVEH